jgi:hypothetical protein
MYHLCLNAAARLLSFGCLALAHGIALGIRRPQAQELLEFHDEHGTAALEARDAPQLTWEQVCCSGRPYSVGYSRVQVHVSGLSNQCCALLSHCGTNISQG